MKLSALSHPLTFFITLLLLLMSTLCEASPDAKSLQIHLRDKLEQPSLDNPIVNTKVVAGNEHNGGSHGQNLIEPLKVNLIPIQNHFRVNEGIRFNVRSNQDFFMYLFTLDEETNQAILLFPNAFQNGNKYPAKQTQVIPDKRSEFYASTAGTEKVIMVASKNYLHWNTDGFADAGNYLQTDLRAFRTQLKQLHVRPAGRDSTISHAENSGNETVIVEEIIIDIFPLHANNPLNCDYSY